MKAAFIAVFACALCVQRCNPSKNILGLWYLNHLEQGDKGVLEIRKDHTFALTYYLEDDVLDTATFQGSYQLFGNDSLLLQYGDSIAEHYLIEQLTPYQLTIKYKATRSEFTRKRPD